MRLDQVSEAARWAAQFERLIELEGRIDISRDHYGNLHGILGFVVMDGHIPIEKIERAMAEMLDRLFAEHRHMLTNTMSLYGIEYPPRKAPVAEPA